MSAGYFSVAVGGLSKGQLEKKRKWWYWHRERGGVTRYPSSVAAIADIERLCGGKATLTTIDWWT